MGKINSRSKGKRGELSAVRFWSDQGWQGGRRGFQGRGGDEAPDIIIPELSDVFWMEVKHCEKLHPYLWMEKATRDSGMVKIPTVQMKSNNRDWMTLMWSTDFAGLLRAETLLINPSGAEEDTPK